MHYEQKTLQFGHRQRIKCRSGGSWSRKQKRCYQRIMSGILYNSSTGKIIRFLTLTTSREAIRDVQTDFRVLKMRIKRKYGVFDYIKIRTNEGYGVLHILYVGTFLPQSWLSRNWKEIHQSPIVDIRSATRMKGLGRYVVSQYLSDQRCSFLRYSWSWKWVYRGFVHTWRLICSNYKCAIKMWNLHLSGRTIPLEGKYLKPPPDVYFVGFEQVMLDRVLFNHQYPPLPTFFARLFEKCDWISTEKA